MPTLYRLAADVTVVAHVAYVAFVLVGQLLTLVGILRHWQWVRNFWFRTLHLACIAVVVIESAWGITCPLTVWENRLRALGGEEPYAGDFLAHWAHDLLFFQGPPWVFTLCYVLFGLLVLATFVLAPPRRPGMGRRKTAAEPKVSG